jgi:hypothetical protein
MDKMSEYLETEILTYSSVNRTRCFNHILNLVGKALLKQFDVKKTCNTDDNNRSAEEQALLDLAEGIEDEELTMALETEMDGEDEDGLDDDLEELEEWVDEVSNGLSAEERAELAENIRPVSCVLVKVCQNLSKYIS